MALTKISRSLLDTGISDSSDATAITIDSSENVGIGTSPTLGAFHVKSAVSDMVTFEQTDAGTVGSKLQLYHNSSSPADGDIISLLTFQGNDDAGNHTSFAGIRGLAADVSNGSEDGTLTFSTTRAGSFTEAMRIDSLGQIGVGTTSPQRQFHIAGGNSTGLKISGNNTGSTSGDGFDIFVRDDNSGVELVQRENTFMTFHTNNTERMRIDSSGYLYVGTTSRIISGVVNVENVGAANCFTGKVSNNAYYNFAGSNSSGTTTFYVEGDGDYYFAGSSQSDRDLKENIQPITESSLAKVKLLEPKTFNFKASEGYATNTKTGFIAQEVAEIFGTETGVASGTDGQKDMGIDTTGIVAHLTKAIQEQQEQIEALQSEINTLKGG